MLSKTNGIFKIAYERKEFSPSLYKSWIMYHVENDQFCKILWLFPVAGGSVTNLRKQFQDDR